MFASNKRHTIGKINKIRESIMTRLLSNDTTLTDSDIALGDFPCPLAVLRNTHTQMLSYIPTAKGATTNGNMNEHYDICIHGDSPAHIELKVTEKKPSPENVLEWQPWKDTVQFLQGQLISSLGKRVLGYCGDPMLHAWFTTEITPFCANIPGTTGITYEGYRKAIFSISKSSKQEPASIALIQHLRENSSVQKTLQQRWLTFETQWLHTHTLDHSGLETVLREIFEQKDWWICVSKTGICWVEGFRVMGISFVGRKQKQKGGTTFQYTVTLQKRSGGVCQEVPFECKFHWKNGGQAVQNLNFMLL